MNAPHTRSTGETIIRQVSASVLTWAVIALIAGIIAAGFFVRDGLNSLTIATGNASQDIRDLTSEVKSLKDRFSAKDLTDQQQTSDIRELRDRITNLETQKPLRLR